jgi:hypothetical protein
LTRFIPEFRYSGPFREAQISEQPLWGFPQVILILSQSRAEQRWYFQKKGPLLHGGSLYFSFHQNWSKLCTLLRTDANESEMKKKVQNF